MMARYGLLGRTLGHSYSPQIHASLGCPPECYTLYEKEPDELDSFLIHPEFDGINVTIPYKKAVIPYLSELSNAARTIGSVNTIVRRADGTLYGDNTDFYGFDQTLAVTGIDPTGKKALVLGDGGAAPTVRAVLAGRGAAQVITISRRGEDNYDNLSRHYDAEIIVNATPVGMYPDVGVSLVDLSKFPKLCGVCDLIYNPARTQLLLDAEKLGVPCTNGLFMLVAQAKRAEELFQNKPIDDGENERLCAKMRAEQMNIALIGMPGVGKSSCGRALAALTGRTLVDLDAELVKQAGTPIPDYFAQYGEEAFRQLETKVLAEFSRQSGLILATGGGVVTRPENYPLLRQNSTVFFLQRDIAGLATGGRPVTQKKGTAQIAAERMPLYLAWADHTIDCIDPQTNAQTILEVLSK